MFVVEEHEDWGDRERLRGEKNTLGLYLTGHPMDGYRKLLGPWVSGSLAELVERAEAADSGAPAGEGKRRRGGGIHARLAGLVVDVMSLRNRVILKLDDGTAQVEATLFSDQADQFRHLLQADNLVVVEGKLGVDPFNNQVRLRPQDMLALDDLLAQKVKGLLLPWRTSELDEIAALEQVLAPARVAQDDAGARIVVDYINGRAKARLRLGDQWRVQVSEQLLSELDGLCSKLGCGAADDAGVQVRYRAAQGEYAA